MENNQESLQKGELRPEIAHLLILLSRPSEGDIFLDPFAGSGAIPFERSNSFPFKEIIASDNDPEKIAKLKERFKNSKISVLKEDILRLEMEVDKIVTDPPWGIYGEKINVASFYPKLLKVFAKILKPTGIIVILLSREIELERILASFPNNFEIAKRINTLVNGQKATVYKLQLR